jgi:hypothetical protein
MFNVKCVTVLEKNTLNQNAVKKQFLTPGNRTKKTCTFCHNSESPDWDENRYTDPETGEKGGFIYKVAVKKVNHSAVKEALQK